MLISVRIGVISVVTYSTKAANSPASIKSALRKNIGIVQQDVYLFNGTIRENIAYGNFDAAEEEIIEAAKKANIHDYIISLPHGYDTAVEQINVLLDYSYVFSQRRPL